MILVLAGTQDGRELAGYLLKADIGLEITASVVSQYGETLLKKYAGLHINDKTLGYNALIEFIKEKSVRVLVDASHPYAANASSNAMAACHAAGIPYIRYERQQTLIEYDKAYYVENYEQAAEQAAELGHSVFLTTGSRNLQVFAKADCLKECRVVCRVLPEPEVLAQCRGLGFTPDNIIAMQGPFSLELNRELYIKYDADVVVTKNSGQVGGTDTKLAAAMELDLPLVIIDRPKVEYDTETSTYNGVLEFIKCHI